MVETTNQYIRFMKRFCTSDGCRNKSASRYEKIFSLVRRLVYGFHTIGTLPGKLVDATGVSLRV
jgi:hypothetical protein